MDPLSAIASVVAIYQLASEVSALCFRYGQGVRGADRDAELVINEIDTFHRYLRTLKEVLTKEAVATDGSEWLRNLNEIISGESAALRLCDRELEAIKTGLVKVKSHGRFQEAIHRLSWPLKKEEVRKTLDTLKKFTEAVDRALNVDNNQVIRGIDSATRRIQESLNTSDAQEIKEKVLDWLAYSDPSEIHEFVRRERNDQAKTGRWLLDGDAFVKFQATPQSVLWLHGESGCGKSVLCSAVIDELIAVQSRDPRTKLAYWYFSVTEKTRTTFNAFLRALIAQLVLEGSTPPTLLDLWNARKRGREAPKSADLEQIARRILGAEPCRIHFVVIDALDESDETERSEIVRFISDLALLEVDIHILITSRTHTAGVEKGMKGLSNFYNIAIEGQTADLDILAHVTERLENDSAFAKWSPNTRQTIKDTLIEKAGGMFRWVEYQLQAVRKCRKPAEVRKILQTLPKDLHEFYERELAKVEENASQDVFRLLEWLAFSGRIRLDEAVDMLAVDVESDDPSFDEENRIIDPEEVLKLCGSLGRLITNAEMINESGAVVKVQPLTAAHTSVIEFLTTQPVKIGPKRVFTFSRAKANLRMAETCLAYLRYISTGNVTLTKDNITSYPFAWLCALNWDFCYREVLASSEPVDMVRVNNLVMELLSSPTATLNWIKLHDPDRLSLGVNFNATMSQVKPAIYYAASLGLPEIVRIFIQKGRPVNEVVGPPFGTPLVAASAMGASDVVSLLIDSGADPNLSGYFDCGTPFAAAVTYGQIEIVKLLLEREGVDINGKRHPLPGSTKEVLEKVEEFRYLMDKDVDGYREPGIRRIDLGSELIELAKNANLENWNDGNYEDRGGSNENTSTNFKGHFIEYPQLTYSASSNCLDETQYRKVLIHAKAASSRILRSSENMLYIATADDLLDVLGILLEAVADPNVRGGFYGTALQKACSGSCGDTVVKTLLENGARTDVYGGFLGSPMNVACRFGSIGAVEYLIKAGADVNRVDAQWSSPLYQASLSKRADVVKLLLKFGADPEIHAKGEDTLLLRALMIGNIEIVKLLLGAGSDVNRTGDEKATPLYWACGKRDRDMVELLLVKGADPNIQCCGTQDYALQEACINGDENIVKLLLKNGAKANLHGGQYGTALHAACACGNDSITQILFSNDADVNASVWSFGSPLSAACERGSVEIAKFLVEVGADIHTKNLVGHSALLKTIYSDDSCLELLDYLIREGADPLEEDKRGSNGLHYAARARKSDVIERMLECALNINTIDRNGWSSLHWAVASTGDSVEVVKLLLDRGCDKSMKDKQGRTALDLAKTFKKKEETIILGGSREARTMSSDNEESRTQPITYLICDGCGVERKHCKPESWHHCNDCIDFDFCFRCILDKDVIHFENHIFSDEPA